MTRQYRLYYSGVSGANSVASIRPVKRGIITAIQWSAYWVNLANTLGMMQFELSKQSTSNLGISDTAGPILGVFQFAGDIASAAKYANYLIAGLQQPWELGEYLYLHTATASAPSSAQTYCHLTVQE